MRSNALAAVLFGLMTCATATSARAQSADDLRPLLDRLDRLERDMNLLQRQVYRGDSGSAPVPVNPPDGSAVNYEVRLGQLDDQMRTLTGQVEEITYDLSQLKHRVDTLASDIDQRLTALEHPGAAPAAAGARPLAAASGGDLPPSAGGGPRPLTAPAGAGANPAEPASRSGVLGQIPADDGEKVAAAGPAAAAAGATGAPPATLPTGSPQDQYNYAFGLLRQANYSGAEQALRAFLQRYPNDPLAGNAQYWLGETYFVRKDFNNAAAVFAEGYQKYPKGGKAADNLLKLAMALGQLGQKADACRALGRLDRDFPTAPGNVKERAGDEKKQLGC
jgi:tol-pal system protein YbgF